MSFKQLRGNEPVVAALRNMVDSDRVPHAILFHEDDGGGAFPLCIAFLQYLCCTERRGGEPCGTCPTCGKIGKLIHPDLHFIFPTSSDSVSEQYYAQLRALYAQKASFTEAELQEALDIQGKNSLIAVGQAKWLLDKLSLSALEGGYRMVIIYLPEKMNQETANRLLKLIEEPPLKTQFLLITHQPEKVLVTIASRCQRIRIAPSAELSAPDFQDPALFETLMDSLTAKNLLSALDAGEKLASLPSRDQAKAFCTYASGILREMFLIQQGVKPSAGTADSTARYAASCPKTFPRKALAVIDRAKMLIDRNVNLKLLFTDMVDRLYIIL